MEAVIKTGGKQYKVSEGDIIEIQKLNGDVGSEVVFDEVLMIEKDGKEPEVKIGAPTVEGASVKAEIVRHGRDKKIVVYTFKRRKGYARKKGHRQDITAVKVKKIVAPAG